MCFNKRLIKNEIILYIKNNIIPEYLTFNKGHGINHVNTVICNSISIAADYPVDINMVYVIAAYHDVGLKNGWENHEKRSSDCLKLDLKLEEWFSKDEIAIMAEAVEDHRASNDYEPRSIYGKIISEADREIDYASILTRTIQYSLKHFPHYNTEQHFERIYQHIQDKYGEKGYLKLWLNTEKNQVQLKKIRNILELTDRIRSDFEKIYSQCTE